MHPDEFRAIALLLPGAEAGAHMGHPDFASSARSLQRYGLTRTELS
jgi:hypothetical protein